MESSNILNISWKCNQNVLSGKIDNEIVLMSTESSYYFTLDKIGSRIWEILTKQPLTIEELASQLIEEYEVDKETCMKDVQEFIDDMAAKKLILPFEQENPPEK